MRIKSFALRAPKATKCPDCRKSEGKIGRKARGNNSTRYILKGKRKL